MLVAAVNGAFLGFFLAQALAGLVLALTGDTVVGSALGGVGAIVVGGLGIQLVKQTSQRGRTDAATFDRLAAEIVRKDATIARLEVSLDTCRERISHLERQLANFGASPP